MCLKWFKKSNPEPVDPVIPDIPPRPPVNDVNLLGHIRYRVMVLDGIDERAIMKALQTVPSYFEFYFGAVDYTVVESGSFKGFHAPVGNWQIIFFNGIKHGFTYGGGCANYGKIGISVDPVYHDTYHLGIRIYHELMHGEGLNSDGMVFDTPSGTDYDKGFAIWLPTVLRQLFVTSYADSAVRHNPMWQRLYYDYLLTGKMLHY